MKPSRYQITTSQNGKKPTRAIHLSRNSPIFSSSSSSSTLPRETRRWRWRQSRPSQLFFFRSSLEHQVVAVADFLLLLQLRTINRRKKVKGKRPRFGSRLGEGKKKPRRKRKTTFTRSRGPNKGRSEDGRSSSCDGCRGRG